MHWLGWDKHELAGKQQKDEAATIPHHLSVQFEQTS
jgi:hypothetical protein